MVLLTREEVGEAAGKQGAEVESSTKTGGGVGRLCGGVHGNGQSAREKRGAMDGNRWACGTWRVPNFISTRGRATTVAYGTFGGL